MEKIAVFDFCGTIVDFQTFDPFLEYVIREEHLFFERWIENKWLKRTSVGLSKIKKGGYLYKKLLINACKGISSDKFSEYGKKYYLNAVKPHCIPIVSEKILELIKEDYRIIILSAGASIYISEYAEEYGITDVIANDFQYDVHGCCTGKLVKRDCIRMEKVRRLKQYMIEKRIEGELLLGVSDNKSDLPFLNMCKHKIIVSHQNHKKWVKGDMEELIWR